MGRETDFTDPEMVTVEWYPNHCPISTISLLLQYLPAKIPGQVRTGQQLDDIITYVNRRALPGLSPPGYGFHLAPSPTGRFVLWLRVGTSIWPEPGTVITHTRPAQRTVQTYGNCLGAFFLWRAQFPWFQERHGNSLKSYQTERGTYRFPPNLPGGR